MSPTSRTRRRPALHASLASPGSAGQQQRARDLRCGRGRRRPSRSTATGDLHRRSERDRHRGGLCLAWASRSASPTTRAPPSRRPRPTPPATSPAVRAHRSPTSRTRRRPPRRPSRARPPRRPMTTRPAHRHGRGRLDGQALRDDQLHRRRRGDRHRRRVRLARPHGRRERRRDRAPVGHGDRRRGQHVGLARAR